MTESVVTTTLNTAESLLAEDWCLVPAGARLDAGYYGISEETCLSKAGTCFDVSDPDAINCYYTKNHASLDTDLPARIEAHTAAIAGVANVTRALEEPARQQVGVKVRDFFRRAFRMLDENDDGILSQDESKILEVDLLAGPPRDAFILISTMISAVNTTSANVTSNGSVGIDFLEAFNTPGTSTPTSEMLPRLWTFLSLAENWLENLALVLSKERLPRDRDRELRVSNSKH